MSRSCSCGGHNENCRFCYGSGMVNFPPELPSLARVPLQKGTVRPAYSLHVKRLAPAQAATAGSRTKSPPSSASPNKIKAAVAIVHHAGILPQKLAKKTDLAPKGGAADRTVCKKCGATVRADRLARHVKKRCPKAKIVIKKPKPGAKAKAKGKAEKRSVSLSYDYKPARIRILQGGLCRGT